MSKIYSPITPIAFVNGKFIELKNAKISILDRGFMLGDGLFETFRTYNGKVFRLNLHLERLERGAKALLIPLPYDNEKLKDIILSIAKKNNKNESYIRLTLTRGESFLERGIPNSIQPNLAIYSSAYARTPKIFYKKGVAVSLFPYAAQSIIGTNERIKSCNYLSSILIRNQAIQKGSFEALMLKGLTQITEGTTSNVFIIKNGILKTPKLNRWVLAGITRHVTLEIAKRLKIPCSEITLKRKDIYQADEAFLTNTGIEILPVTMVDNKSIGGGQLGPLTRKLQRTFAKTVEGEE